MSEELQQVSIEELEISMNRLANRLGDLRSNYQRHIITREEYESKRLSILEDAIATNRLIKKLKTLE